MDWVKVEHRQSIKGGWEQMESTKKGREVEVNHGKPSD